MPLYFFKFTRTQHGKPSPSENDGLELADDNAAWEEATTACGEILREMDGSLRPGDGWKMDVTGGDGKAVFILKFMTEISGG